jgi:hypothetical protein
MCKLKNKLRLSWPCYLNISIHCHTCTSDAALTEEINDTPRKRLYTSVSLCTHAHTSVAAPQADRSCQLRRHNAACQSLMSQFVLSHGVESKRMGRYVWMSVMQAIAFAGMTHWYCRCCSICIICGMRQKKVNNYGQDRAINWHKNTYRCLQIRLSFVSNNCSAVIAYSFVLPQ